MIDFLAKNSGILGMLLFLIFFIGSAIKLWMPGAKQKYEAFGNMPFLEDETNDK